MAQQESYQGLARKWRPQRFEDLVGQEAVAQSFQNALRQGRVVHGHLLAGPRGVGKTTSARILAMALNCEQGPTPTPCGQCRHCLDIAAGNDMDVIEIDAASNTGVDNIRELRERVIQAPFAARYKVYIIDEIHMLSTGAFNALLKTLEEPPAKVIFIFATTELEKVPETIRSRCVLHSFRRMGAEDIVRRLEQVTAGEGLTIDPAVAREVFGLIARSVEGGMRDALVSYDQLIAMTEGKPDVEAATKLLGLADHAALTQTVAWLAEGNAAELLKLIEQLVDRGRSLERFIKSLIAYLRDLMLLQAAGSDQLVALTGEALQAAKDQASQLAPATLFNILNQMFELEGKLKQSTQARFLIEFTFLRIAAVRPVVPIEEIMKRVRALPEGTLASAPPTAQPAPPAPVTRSIAANPLPERPVRSLSRVAAPSSGPSSGMMAVMQDSDPIAPATPEPAPAVAVPEQAPPPVQASAAEPSPAPFVAPPSGDLLASLTQGLPDPSRFLARYLRQASALQLEQGGLRVLWGTNTTLARRMVEKSENVHVIEETLTRLYGRPMHLWHEDAAPDAGLPQPPPVSSHEHSLMVHAEELINAGAQPWPAPGEDATESEVAPGESDGEDDEGPAMAPARPAEPHSEEAPPDRRSALQKAQDFLAASDDARRRVKLLRDMLSGRLIDDQGQPLPI